MVCLLPSFLSQKKNQTNCQNYSKYPGRFGVLLDKRTLKTPGGIPILLEKDRLAVAVLIAEEWENQLAVLKPHTLPMVSSSLPPAFKFEWKM